MHDDFDNRLSQVANQAGHAGRLRSAAAVRARGNRRRTRHRVGAAALSAGALGLTASGAAALIASTGTTGHGPVSQPTSPTATGPSSPAPSSSAPETPAPANITPDMLLTAADLNKVGDGWQEVATGTTDDGRFLRCQRDTLASLGATEVLVRTFQRSGLGDEPLSAGQLIAYFPDAQAAQDANGTLFQWVETCADYATGGGGKLAAVGGGLVTDTVQRRGPEGPGNGAAWQLMFDDDRTDDNAWFDSIGIGFMAKPFVTIVTYDDYGQDANYDFEQMPGVVLLQDAFAKLPT